MTFNLVIFLFRWTRGQRFKFI